MQLNSDQSMDHLGHELKDLPKNLVCFSHLRWDFVFQRPQHLLTRLAKAMKVFYVEEPVVIASEKLPHYLLQQRSEITLIIPQLPAGLNPAESVSVQEQLLDDFMIEHQITNYAFWYYTPMALEFSRKYKPELTVFDCMDELSAFKFAPESLKTLEKELLKKADVVFTGGHSLYEAKKDKHTNIYAFPSSIDKSHFAKARMLKKTAENQDAAYRPKLGFYGVIDERFDAELIKGIADARPDWDLMLLGPVVKIDPQTLPQKDNIYYIGTKSYAELPDLMAAWDIALIPFLLNESTRFISPTKTPEYLAAGLPVISTAIRDVVNPYGELGLVSIGDTPAEFVMLSEKELDRKDKKEWQQKVDLFLSNISWDITCAQMVSVMSTALNPAPVFHNTLVQS
ncbi:glycosyltransferase [Mucilaginibacter terrae]|uniref:Glycosyltransferase involved in cell wall biosynthesis n=1 Tax=Mucilaginibacter terrae TaxID=1955052 RepID=A0ABU3GZY5_9SPHI|nr:glycosyltransferase [Mucilaginibacter terrae]MDT3405329.1 glycosyltransferase involved in cell wall biosynthesis [Mucilaginibacter terrae]